MKRHWSNIRSGLLIIALFLFLWGIDLLLVFWYYNQVQNFLEEQSGNIEADAGVVFFGDYNHDGTLGPDSQQRALTAYKLYQKGSIGHIICVGGYDYRVWEGQSHPMQTFLLNLGVAKDHILYDSLSFNTITNWREAVKIIQHNQFKTVIAISAPLHIYRISRMIDEQNVFYCSYTYTCRDLKDYTRIYRDVHHEFVSRSLSLVFKDDVRNRLVYIVRTLIQKMDIIL